MLFTVRTPRIYTSLTLPSRQYIALRPRSVPHTYQAPSFRLHLSTTRAEQTQYRSMSSEAKQPLQEWLIICPDFPGALEKRLAVRAKHLEGLQGDAPDFWLAGGAMLSEPITEGQTPKMAGSAMICGARTKEEVMERLKRDIYVTGEVWDWDKVQIHPFKSALRKAL